MNKSVVGGLIVLVLVLVGGGVLLATNKSDDKTGDTTNSSSSDMNDMNNSSSSNSDTSDAVATTKVSIKDMAFTPANITVKVGDTVTWTNNDSIAHDVTETDGQSGPKSDLLQPGKSYVFTYDHAGTYHYNCSIHPGMTGSVVVTER